MLLFFSFAPAFVLPFYSTNYAGLLQIRKPFLLPNQRQQTNEWIWTTNAWK